MVVLYFFIDRIGEMKKSALKILILIMCLNFFSVTAFADEEIKLYIDGDIIETDVAPEIVNDRTLIPVRCFFEKFDAKVSWVESTKQVVIENDDKSIILKIDDKTAYVNNEAVKLDVAPVIKNDRTLVPVRFISENLGYNVDWKDETRSVYITSPEPVEEESVITKVSVTKSKTSTLVTVKADNFKKPSISSVEEPLRYILDFENARLEGKDAKINVGNKDIKEVRYAQHDDYARVVIECPSDAEFTCTYRSDYMTIKVVGEKVLEDDEEKTEDDEENQEDEEIEEPVIKELLYVDKPVVVIDAGHGGKDMGAIGYDEEGNELIYESEANLEIALGVEKYLKQKGVSVIMTRTKDVALGDSEMDDLLKRSEIANDANATLFVSIHNNAFTDAEASGTMVLYADTDNKLNYGITSKSLAKNILSPLVKAIGLLDRGVVDSPKMVVLKKTDMPSVLIECAFVTCEQDREILLDEEKVDDISYAIAEGIIKTIGELPKK